MLNNSFLQARSERRDKNSSDSANESFTNETGAQINGQFSASFGGASIPAAANLQASIAALQAGQLSLGQVRIQAEITAGLLSFVL